VTSLVCTLACVAGELCRSGGVPQLRLGVRRACLVLGPWMGGVCPGTMDAGPIRPHRVLPCRIDRPVWPGHHHHHRGCRRRGHRAPGASHRRRDLRRWWLPHRPQCRACPAVR